MSMKHHPSRLVIAVSLVIALAAATAAASWTDYLNPFALFTSASDQVVHTAPPEGAGAPATVEGDIPTAITVTVSGTAVTNPPLAASYGSLAAALTDLNAVTSYTTPGTIIFTLSGSETAPVKGFAVGSATLNP